jgi:malonyl-ACP O-methyltransferase BioC
MKNICLTHHETKIKQAFNKSFMTYDLYSDIQQFIGKKLLLSMTSYPVKIINIIDLGCGTGFLTKQLAELYSYKNFYAIDIAEQLLKKARERLSSFAICIDENNFQNFHYENILFDLVFSNMALHWSLNFQNTLFNIHHNMALGGLLICSLPLDNTFHELNRHARNQFYSKNDILLFLNKAGFSVLNHFTEQIVLHFHSITDVLKSIKAVGANYHSNKSHTSLRGKSFINTLFNKTVDSKTYSLTYEIGYFISRKTFHGT